MSSRLSIVLWSLAAVLGLGYTDTNAAPKSATNEHGQLIAELHQAKHLLDHANHDYNGHRAKADHEISKAIHLLHPEHHKKHTMPHKSPTAAAKEAQQTSDTQLRQAEKLVRAALLTLDKHQGEKAHDARKVLHKAVHEIELAIQLHHEHHAKKAATAN